MRPDHGPASELYHLHRDATNHERPRSLPPRQFPTSARPHDGRSLIAWRPPRLAPLVFRSRDPDAWRSAWHQLHPQGRDCLREGCSEAVHFSGVDDARGELPFKAASKRHDLDGTHVARGPLERMGSS